MVSVTRKDSNAALDVTAVQKAFQPPPADCQTMAASGSRTMMESHVVATPTRSDVPPWRPPKKPAEPPAPSPAPVVVGARQQLSSGGLFVDLGDGTVVLIEQNWVHRIPATEVGDGPQLLRGRKSVLKSAATAGSTGRNPACAHSFCASAVYRKFFSELALSTCALPVTTATGFSILNVWGGLTCSTGLPCRSMLMASFS